MSKFEEKKYKQSLLEDTPDLWEQIDSKLDGIYQSDSKPDMDMTPNNNSNIAKKKRHINIYKVSGLIAACIGLILIPLSISLENGGKNMSTVNKDSTSSEYANNDSITNNVMDGIDSIDSIDSNSSTDDIKGIAPEEFAADIDKDSPSNEGNATVTKACINFVVKGTVHTPDIGLIYYGTVNTTNTDKIPTNSTVYVSLRNLSRTELRNQHKIGSAIKVTINDFSYTSSETKPYYASSIIKN